jgi:hypothetical protein
VEIATIMVVSSVEDEKPLWGILHTIIFVEGTQITTTNSRVEFYI